MLDLWQNNTAVAAQPQPQEGRDLPATFGDTFDAAWSEGRLATQSIAHGNAQMGALDDYLGDVQAKSGQDIRKQIYGRSDMIPAANEAVAKLRQGNPDLDIPDLTDGELDRRAVAKSREAMSAAAAMSGREKTLGGAIGGFLGGTAAAITDPINLVALAVAPAEGLGILKTALAWGGIAGASQAAIEATNAPYREQVQPGYGASGAPAASILESAGGGALLGGVLKGVGAAWTRAKTGAWPQSVRDAGNVVESEAHVQNTNVLPGIDGEVAHREALGKAIDDVVAARPVEPPESVTAIPKPQPGGIEAFHGSTHNFERFDASKIGIGEGAQSYGHGLYFAENEAVARGYMKAGDIHLSDAEFVAQEALQSSHGNREAALEYIKNEVGTATENSADKAAELIKSGWEPPKGNLYKVRINADKEHFLDWDKPLDEQTERVQAAVKHAMGIDYYGKFDPAKAERLWEEHKYADASDAVRRGLIAFTDPTVAARLREAGIPGIKYLDQGSRGGGFGGGGIGAGASLKPQATIGATHNFVLFDDKLAQITHKNGEPLSLFDQHEAKIDRLMDERGAATDAAVQAKAERATSTELPFTATAKEAAAEMHVGAIADGVGNIARMVGYDMPRDEAMTIANRVAGAKSDDEAREILSAVADRPRTLADTLPSAADVARQRREAAAEAPEPITQTAEQMRATLAEPDHQEALRADIDRARAMGDVKVPGLDDKGNHTMVSVDAGMREVDAYKAAAEQIHACAAPEPEEKEAA